MLPRAGFSRREALASLQTAWLKPSADSSPSSAVLALALVLMLVGCGSAPKTTSTIRLAVGGQAQMIYWPATLAESLGFYKEQGLDVTIQDFPGGSKALESLFGGSADVVCGFYDHTVQMAAQGRELRAFISLLRYPGLVATTTSPAIKTLADLRGKPVGVSAAGSSTHMFLNYLLTEHGLKPEDISVVQIGLGATAVAAAGRNRVEAEIVTDPTVGLLRKQVPSLRILADTRDREGVRQVFGVDAYPASVLYSTSTWLGGHREETTRLVRAVEKTLAWMRSHSPEEIRQRMPAPLRIEDAEVELDGVKSLKNMLSEDGAFTANGAATVQRVLATSMESVRNAKVDLSNTYTNEYLSPAPVRK
jgi:NitT/TauT family transport system substrate-binding protein